MVTAGTSVAVAAVATTQDQGTISAVATDRVDTVVAVMEVMASRAETEAMDRVDMEAMAVGMEEMEAGTREEDTVVAVVEEVEGDIRYRVMG